MIEKLNANTQLPSASPQQENPMVAMGELFALLNEAMHESAMVQGDAATDLGKGLQHTAHLMKELNDSTAAIQSRIQSTQSSMADLRPWMMILGIAAGLLMVAAPGIGVAAGAALGVGAVESITATTELVGSVAAIASGGVGIAEGAYQLQLADCTGELAGKNGAISELSGALQNTQATSKWMTTQMSETLTRRGEMARSVTEGLKEVSQGIKAASRDMVSGVMGSR